MSKTCAVVAITKNGVDIARRISLNHLDCHVFYPEKFAQGDEVELGIHLLRDNRISELISEIFHEYRSIIGILSLGAMVRLIAPLLVDKKTDPAIVVVDDKAKHVVSVLSGHLGGANQLACEIAEILGANPVITTASDVGHTIAVDLLGRRLGFEIENFACVKKASAAIVNEEMIHIIQESGEQGWWPDDKPLPNNIRLFYSLREALLQPFGAALVITHRLLSKQENQLLGECCVVYRPKVIVVGIGCNRGTSAGEIEQAIGDVLSQAQISLKSIRNMATIDIKQDEQGLLEVCNLHGWRLETFRANELNTVKLSNPSEMVYKYVGAYGVSEPAARLSSRAESSIIEKVKHGNVTISVCLVHDDLEKRDG